MTDATRPAGRHELTEAECGRVVCASIDKWRVLNGPTARDGYPADVLLVEVARIKADAYAAGLAARGADAAVTDNGLADLADHIRAIHERPTVLVSHSGLTLAYENTRNLILRAALDAAPAPTVDQPQSTCSCGSPDAYSLNRAERIVHRSDGPCYFAPTEDHADDTAEVAYTLGYLKGRASTEDHT